VTLATAAKFRGVPLGALVDDLAFVAGVRAKHE
jgi:hypothetical protein